jgi:hypothetical protein
MGRPYWRWRDEPRPPTPPVRPRPPVALRRSRQARQLAIVTVIIEVAALANIAAAITALIRHSIDIGVVTGVIALALILAVWTLARAVTPTRPPTQHPPPPVPGARD